MPQHPYFSGLPTFWRSPPSTVQDAGKFDAVVLGVPYEAGVSFREGTKFAPRALREAAFVAPPNGRRYVNLDDPHETLVARDILLGDIGDIEVWPKDPSRTLECVRQTVRDVRMQTLPVIIGGDHSITYPAWLGCREASGNHKCGLIFFDGDTDAEDSFLTLDRYWHGDVIRRLVDDGHVDPRHVFLVGQRGIIDANLYDWTVSRGVSIFSSRDVRTRGIETIMNEIAERLAGCTDRVYVSIDIDVVDASVAAGTGWPGWGGLHPNDIFRAMRCLSRFSVTGIDLVEISPPLDPSGLTVLLGMEVLWNFLRFGFRK